MSPPDLDAGLCRQLAPEVLERTFFYPGPPNLARPPGGAAQRAWDKAKEICIECPVYLRCRASAMGAEYGVVGGTDEHERYVHRRRLNRQLAAKSDADRAALAAYLHVRYADGLGDSPVQLARATGYSKTVVAGLIAEHQALLERAEPPEAAEIARWKRAEEAIAWPRADPPKADGWVWYRDRIQRAHYVGETKDGAYVLMKVKPLAAQTTRWFPAQHVDLRSTTPKVIKTWVNRPSEGRDGGAQADDQRAGQSAA